MAQNQDIPMRTFLLLAGLLYSLACGHVHASTIIHAGRLIDGRSDQPRTEVTITVDGDLSMHIRIRRSSAVLSTEDIGPRA